MRLLDMVAQSTRPMIVEMPADGRIWRLPGADTLADDVRRCPLRYVLHDKVTEMCTQLAFEGDTILGSAMALLRVPAPRLWLEFRGAARNKVFTDLDRADTDPNAYPQQRIGLLVTSDESGRKGTVSVCWDSEGSNEPALAPFVIEFDFDDDSFSSRGRASANGMCIGVGIGDHPDLGVLFDRVRFNLRPEWHNYYRSCADSEHGFRPLLKAALKPLLEDVPFLATFCLLLISNSALRSQPCDRSVINRSRERKGRSPLLDHVELTMSLGEGEGTAHQADVHRSAPRLHFVRGHLVRRRDTIYWRTSHMRGKPNIGSISTRTVSLRMTGS